MRFRGYEITIEDDTVLLNDINTAADFRDSIMKSRVCEHNTRPAVALQFARVKVRGCRGATEVTVMVDTGADRSYFTNDLVNALAPRWIDREPVTFASFGSGKPSKTKLRDKYSVSLQDANGMDHTLFATAVDVICAPFLSRNTQTNS